VGGEEIKACAPAPRRTGQVVDIFAALKKSLETAERPQSATTEQGKKGIKKIGNSHWFAR
jgi:non-homologous end joining protein Ku